MYYFYFSVKNNNCYDVNWTPLITLSFLILTSSAHISYNTCMCIDITPAPAEALVEAFMLQGHHIKSVQIQNDS